MNRLDSLFYTARSSCCRLSWQTGVPATRSTIRPDRNVGPGTEPGAVATGPYTQRVIDDVAGRRLTVLTVECRIGRYRSRFRTMLKPGLLTFVVRCAFSRFAPALLGCRSCWSC